VVVVAAVAVICISLYSAHPPNITITTSIARVSMRFLTQQTQSFTASAHHTHTNSKCSSAHTATPATTTLTSPQDANVQSPHLTRYVGGGVGLARIMQVNLHDKV
jgi:Flp pilus assembly protein TadG